MEGAESWTPALLEIKVSGSADRAAQFPVAAGTIMLGGWSHGHCSPPATVFSGAMGSGATAGGSRIAGTTSTVWLVCPLSVFQPTHLYIYRCVELFSIMVCGTEETLLSYGNYCLCLEGKRQKKCHRLPWC